jgi:hypothetical protein
MKKMHAFKVIRLIKTLQIMKKAYSNFRENWVLHDTLNKIQRAGKLITRAAKRFLKRKGAFKHERVLCTSQRVYSWMHIMQRDLLICSA